MTLDATLNAAMHDLKCKQDNSMIRRKATECSARKVLLDGEAMGLEQAMEIITRHAKFNDIKLDIVVNTRGYIPTITVFWKDGGREVLHGAHLAEALGDRYTDANLERIAFDCPGDDRNHAWDKDAGQWENTNHRVGIKF